MILYPLLHRKCGRKQKEKMHSEYTSDTSNRMGKLAIVPCFLCELMTALLREFVFQSHLSWSRTFLWGSLELKLQPAGGGIDLLNDWNQRRKKDHSLDDRRSLTLHMQQRWLWDRPESSVLDFIKRETTFKVLQGLLPAARLEMLWRCVRSDKFYRRKYEYCNSPPPCTE